VVLAAAAVIALAALAARAGHEEEEGITAAVTSLRPLPPVGWLFVLTAVLYGIAESIIGNWTAVYLTQDKYFSVTTASLALSFFWTFMTVGRVGATFLTWTVDARMLYRLSPVVILAGLLYIVETRVESRILLGYMIAGLGCSYFFPLTISLSTEYLDEWREVLPPLVVAGLMLGVSIGSGLVGALRDRGVIGLDQAFGSALGSAAAAGILALILVIRKPVPVRTGDGRRDR
jgi:fucose permease